MSRVIMGSFLVLSGCVGMGISFEHPVVLDNVFYNDLNDGDGVVRPGEVFTVGFDVHNGSFWGLDDVIVQPSLHSTCAMLSDTYTVKVGQIDAGDTVSIPSDLIEVQTRSDCPDAALELTVGLLSNRYDGGSTLTLPFRGTSPASISLDNVVISDATVHSANNNGDGLAQVGERVAVGFDLHNIGSGALRGVVGRLAAVDACVDTQGSAEVGMSMLLAQDSLTVPTYNGFIAGIGEDCTQLTSVGMALILTDVRGEMRRIPFTIPIDLGL